MYTYILHTTHFIHTSHAHHTLYTRHYTYIGRIYYTMQISTAPPTLVFFCNDPDLFNDNYKKFLERKLRDSLQFDGKGQNYDLCVYDV